MSEQVVGEGSYLTPRLGHARVADAMRHGILSCPDDASVRDAARTMCSHHVHTIIVTDSADGSVQGILTDRALLDALLTRDGGGSRLAEITERGYPSVATSETLLAAAQLMQERDVAHLVVVDEHTGRPTGMLSTLDLAGVLAWGEA